MANEKRLIDANEHHSRVSKVQMTDLFPDWKEFPQDVQEKLTKLGKAHERLLFDAPTADAVGADEMREFAQDVAYQFGYYCQNGGRLHITHGGMSTLEQAFDILGWENPHPVPECECEIDGCHEHATCGAPTKEGYKRMCGKHCREREAE